LIDQFVDAFPSGKLAGLVLLLDALLAATLLDLCALLAKFGGSRIHGGARWFEC
jgi:hypothetical protein